MNGLGELAQRASQFLPHDPEGLKDFLWSVDGELPTYGEFFHAELSDDGGITITELDDWPGGEIEYFLTPEEFSRLPQIVAQQRAHNEPTGDE